MAFGGGRNAAPLTVAAIAFAVGGMGNVAFSLHDGSQAGLAAIRFILGALLAGTYLHLRRTRTGSAAAPEATTTPPARTRTHNTSARLRGTPLMWLLCASGLEALGIALLMAAADHAPTAVFTVIALCSPAITALLARPLRLPRATPIAAALATAAILSAAGATWSASGSGTHTLTWLGVLLATGSMISASGSAVSASIAVRHYHPAALLALTCLFGIGITTVWIASGSPLVITTSTILAAAFIALIPGGIAKMAWLWANGKTAPQLVQSMVAIAVTTALLGGWLLLGEQPTVMQALLSLLAAGLVGVVALLRTPTQAPPPKHPHDH